MQPNNFARNVFHTQPQENRRLPTLTVEEVHDDGQSTISNGVQPVVQEPDDEGIS